MSTDCIMMIGDKYIELGNWNQYSTVFKNGKRYHRIHAEDLLFNLAWDDHTSFEAYEFLLDTDGRYNVFFYTCHDYKYEVALGIVNEKDEARLQAALESNPGYISMEEMNEIQERELNGNES